MPAVLHRCPKCRALWLGPGIHAPHWKVHEGVAKLVDCVGKPLLEQPAGPTR